MTHESREFSRKLGPIKLNQPMRLKNQNCPYCGEMIHSPAEKNVDHVIGRRFVPKNTLANSWNLLVNAHKTCNAEKADYENDISAITLQQLAASTPDFSQNSKLLKAELTRKQRARSFLTRKYVGESHESLTIGGALGATKLTFTLASPPRLSEDRVLRLAALQIRGLASLIFSDERTLQFSYLPSCIVLVVECSRGDWGNVRAKSFMGAVSEWEVRLLIAGLAEGYFQAVIRKEPGSRPVWAWALEWNKALRLMGFMGDEVESLQEMANELPEPSWDRHWQTDSPEKGRILSRMRLETPLAPDEDTLFAP
jgi:hypothetical protein